MKKRELRIPYSDGDMFVTKETTFLRWYGFKLTDVPDADRKIKKTDVFTYRGRKYSAKVDKDMYDFVLTLLPD